MSRPHLIDLCVNGTQRTVRASSEQTLLEVLRDELYLTGPKRGCNQGVCGACTVLIDNQPVRSCLSLAVLTENRAITTVEGLSEGKSLTPLQQSIIDCGAVQCGFCTGGLLVVAHALLADNPHPTSDQVRSALSGNLCRCSGYAKIVEAVCRANEGSLP
jgi:aerobic-type carbon monoxide dehydrogenase small subunit (CoxS/CutS family)